ncbi:UNVERIFIED_CONTAM: hypothetical protein NCL1_34038 [Trichonephila clavipes]
MSESVKKSLNCCDVGHRTTSKMAMERKVWVFEDDPTSTMVKRQRAVTCAVFFRSTGLINTIKLEGQKKVTAIWYTI